MGVDLNRLHDIHETMAGRLGDPAMDAFAGAVIAGRPDEAVRTVLSCTAEDPAAAAAFVDDFIALAREGRRGRGDLDGTAVREVLRVQPCQADIAEMSANGFPDAAALLGVLYEGYAGAAAREAAGMLAAELEGTPVTLAEIDPALARAAPVGAMGGPRYLVRLGDRLVAGLFRDEGGKRWFEEAFGRRVPLSRVAQAWEVGEA